MLTTTVPTQTVPTQTVPTTNEHSTTEPAFRLRTSSVARSRGDLRILDVRDDAIRAALAADINYADLESVTDLSRSALDAIRRSARSRGTP